MLVEPVQLDERHRVGQVRAEDAPGELGGGLPALARPPARGYRVLEAAGDPGAVQHPGARTARRRDRHLGRGEGLDQVGDVRRRGGQGAAGPGRRAGRCGPARATPEQHQPAYEQDGERRGGDQQEHQQ